MGSVKTVHKAANPRQRVLKRASSHRPQWQTSSRTSAHYGARVAGLLVMMLGQASASAVGIALTFACTQKMQEVRREQ